MVGDDDLTVSDEYFGEQFPLSPLDDYMIHQTPDPIRVMWTGDFRGWVEVDGTRIELAAGSQGTRDRHWGTGRGVGGPALSFGGRLHVGVSGNAFVAFPSWKLWGDRVYYPFGDRRAGSARVGKP